MGVGLVRSLQAPDTLWIHWRVYNSIANTRKRVLFLPPSDVYVRSFLYLLYTFSSVQFSPVAQSCLTLCDPMNHSVYTLIKFYYTKALSNQASPLAPDWILLLRRPRITASLRDFLFDFQFSNHWKCFYLPYQLTLKTAPIYFNRD